MSEGMFDTRLTAEWRAAVTAVVIPAASDLMANAGREQASRTAAIAEVEDVSLTFDKLRASLDDDDRARLLATTRWSVKDVIAHLASWARQTRVEVERFFGRQPFDEIIAFGRTGPHTWNQREVDRRVGRSLDELFTEIDAEHARIIELLADAPDAEMRRTVDLPRTIGEPPASWRMTMTATIVMTCWHARLHLNRIERLLREAGSQE